MYSYRFIKHDNKWNEFKNQKMQKLKNFRNLHVVTLLCKDSYLNIVYCNIDKNDGIYNYLTTLISEWYSDCKASVTAIHDENILVLTQSDRMLVFIFYCIYF